MFSSAIIFPAIVLASMVWEEEMQIDIPCMISSDCGPDECCLNQNGTVGGYCTPKLTIGSACTVNISDNRVNRERLFYDDCPCMSALCCVLDEVDEQAIIAEGVCSDYLPYLKGRVEPCFKEKPCGKDECCVSKLLEDESRAESQCQKLSQEGASCLVISRRSKIPQYECPCSPGLTCEGLGVCSTVGQGGICKNSTR